MSQDFDIRTPRQAALDIGRSRQHAAEDFGELPDETTQRDAIRRTVLGARATTAKAAPLHQPKQFGDLTTRITGEGGNRESGPAAIHITHSAGQPHSIYAGMDVATGAAATVNAPYTRHALNSDAVDPSYRTAYGSRPVVMGDYEQRMHAGPHVTNPPLFQTYHSPPKIDLLGSTQDAPRGSAHAVIGLAALESHARWGEHPEASGDLSEHSARLVNRLAERGVIKAPDQSDFDFQEFPKGKLAHATNPIQHAWGDEHVENAHAEAVVHGSWRPPSHANFGRQFMSNVLRANPKKKPAADTGTQGTLF